MTNSNLVHLVMILDRSGSMASTAQDVIGGFNKFKQDQSAQSYKANMTVVLFDNEYHLLHNNIPIEKVPDLTHETYFARGTTALNDAIGKTLTDVGTILANTLEPQRPGKVIVTIFTDGQENASREFSTEKVRQTISHQQTKYNWEFMYFGATPDTFTSAAMYGIAADTTILYSTHKFDKSYQVLSNTVTRGCTSGNFSFNVDERGDVS